MLKAIGLALVVSACGKESKPSTGTEPGAPDITQKQPSLTQDAHSADVATDDAESEEDGACPKAKEPRTTAARKTGIHGRTLPHELGYVWHSKTTLKVYDRDNNVVRKVDGKDVPHGVIGLDDDSWFVAPCEKPNCDRHGTGHLLSRVDKATGASVDIYGPENEFAFGEVFGDHFYWATSGIDGRTGELRRVPRKGTKVETLWSGGGVHTVLIDRDTAFVADSHAVFAVPLNGKKPRELVSDLLDPRGLATDGHELYITDRGDPSVQSKDTGRVLRVLLAGGTATTLAGPIRWPTVIAVDDDRIYFMGDKSGDVWSAPKAGGTAAVLIPIPPGDWPCRRSTWLRADSSGLAWMRIDDGFGFIRGAEWFIPRSMLADPQKQWRDKTPTASP